MPDSAPPSVSVIVATFNQGGYLSQCLDSLVGQTIGREAYEIIVVDDGSTDDTAQIISKYASQRNAHIEVVTHPQRQGLVPASNAGIRQAGGDYLVRVDSDDWLDVKALEELMVAAESNQSPDIIIPDYWVVKERHVTLARPDIDNLFTWVAGGPLLRRETVLKVGEYRRLFWEEYDLYLRMLSQGARAARLKLPVLYHRKHATSMTARRRDREYGWKELVDAWSLNVLQRFGAHRALTRCAKLQTQTSQDVA